jgi:hypothetical protein
MASGELLFVDRGSSQVGGGPRTGRAKAGDALVRLPELDARLARLQSLRNASNRVATRIAAASEQAER